jgi:flavin-dependent dehydrogenase
VSARAGAGADVLVVGGRVAGSLTALRLAERGAAVRVLESRHFPSDTLSTHFFRGDGLVRSLVEVGVLDEVLATGAPPLPCEYFALDDGPAEQGPPQEPGDIGFCLSVRRITLDAILSRRCVQAGVDVRTGTRVVDVVREDGRVVGAVDGEGTTHRAVVVVGADGRRSRVASLVGAAYDDRQPAARAMYYRYATGWQSPEELGAEFSLVGDDLVYVFPSDGDLACIAVSITLAAHEAAQGDPGGHLDARLRAHPSLAGRAEAITWSSGVFTGRPADSVLRRAAGPGWALVGDAGTGQDPWAGMGMDTAARQAEAFAEAFTEHPDDWEAAYPRLRRERTLAGYEEATRFAPDLRAMLDFSA